VTEKPHPFYHNEAIDLTDDPGLPNSRAIAIGLSRISEQLDFLIDLIHDKIVPPSHVPGTTWEETVADLPTAQVRLPGPGEPWDYIWYDQATGVPYGIKREGGRVGVYDYATGKWRHWWPKTTDRDFRRVLGLEA